MLGVEELKKENEELRMAVAFLCGCLHDEMLKGHTVITRIARDVCGIELRRDCGERDDERLYGRDL